MSDKVLERNGDELRIETLWLAGHRLIILSWYRRKKNGNWKSMKKADAMGLVGLAELEQLIVALEKARDWLKQTGG